MTIQLTHPTPAQLASNINKLYLFTFAHMFIVLLPVIVPFFQSRQMSMQQIYEVQAAFAFTVVLFEVPSGYFADIWGRKLTMAIGALLACLGFTALAFVRTYTGFLFVEFILGVGFAMVSGADLSLLYDSSKALNRTESGNLGNMQFFNSMGEAVAAVLGGLLAAWSFEWAVWASAGAMGISFVVALTVTEVPRSIAPGRHMENLKSALGELLQQGHWVRLLVVNFLYWSLVTYAIVWLYQKYWADQGIDIVYFGYLWALFNLSVAISAKLTPQLERWFTSRWTLVLVPLLYLVGLLGMGFAVGAIGVLFSIGLNLGRGIGYVVLKEAINARVGSEFRATINSLLSLGVRLGYCIAGPLVGFFTDTRGVPSVMQGVACTVVAASVLLLLPLIYKRSNWTASYP